MPDYDLEHFPLPQVGTSGCSLGDSKAPSDDATWQNCRVGKVGLGGKRIFVSWHSLEGGKLGWLSTWTEFGK